MFVWCAGSILWLQIHVVISGRYSGRYFFLILKKFSQIAFETFRNIKNDKLQSCSLKLCKKYLPTLDFPSILKTAAFKESGIIDYCQKIE